MVNALPLPALDGGYLALLALEAVRRKKLDQVLFQPFFWPFSLPHVSYRVGLG